MPDHDRLSPDDWIDAGLAALAEGGPAAVKVDVLATKIGMTRGSFYWHFKNRKALLDALVKRWARAETDDVIAEVQGLDLPAGDLLRELLARCFADDGALERAFRLWAGSDAAVAEAVGDIDRRRIGFLVDLLKDAGVPPDEADARARIVYRAWLGDYALVDAGDRDAEADVAMLAEMALAHSTA
ncbi:MAG: TetR/AcrR family transcriptional regulator [Phyllobacteriaceae bacterium]|nr:TetR/AcrR family transcriptional regulator [Phyllobacteriaceae bacterium]